MDKQRQEEIIKLLNEKGAVEPCPRCKNRQFELLSEASIPFEEEEKSPGRSFVPNLPVIPVIVLACNNCGYITFHAEGILDPKTRIVGSRWYK